MTTPTATAGDLLQALRERYAAPEYALLPQVRNGTGFSQAVDRTADAIALGLWPSRGIHLHGFEIKVYRGDWQRELRRPDKAEPIARHCHYWWIVAPNVNVVPVDELPSTWGLLVLSGKRLHVAHQAPFSDDATPVSLGFVAAILRKAAGSLPGKEELEAARKRGLDEGKKAADAGLASKLRQLEERHGNLNEMVKRFEEAAGVKLDEWRAEHIGAAVRRVLAGEEGAVAAKLTSARRSALEFLDQTHDFASRSDLPFRHSRDALPSPMADALEALLPAEDPAA